MYIFAVLLFSAFAILEVFNKEITEKNRVVFSMICFLFLILHDGLRWETGSDWDAYLGNFNRIYEITAIDESIGGFEPGFMLLFSSVKVLTDDYTIYLMVHAILFYTAFFYCIFKLSDYPFVTILIFYMITVPFMGMNRQFLAMALFSVALVMLIENKKWIFVLIILFALLFHRTAILTLPILFFNRNIKRLYIVIALVICTAISFSGVLNTLSASAALVLGGGDDTTGQKLDYYVNADNEFSIISTVLSLARKLIWLSLLLVFESKINNKDSKYYTLRNTYAFSIMFYILFNGTALQIIISRGLLYYNLTEMFMIPYVLTLFCQNYGKLLVMFMLVLYCFINIYKGFSNYGENTDYFTPYKGLFINTDYDRKNTD